MREMITMRTIPDWTGHVTAGAGATTATVPDWTGLAGESGAATLTTPAWTGLSGQGSLSLARTIPDWTCRAAAGGLLAPAPRLVGLGHRRALPGTGELELDTAA
ncbi:MAG: hypothetical protein ACLQGJ_11575 [Candidatus Dormibacteria bacterium]